MKKINVPFYSFEKINSLVKNDILENFSLFLSEEQYILGPQVKAFESQYAKFSNTKECIGISNGLDAITLSLKALDIGLSDEVIVPSNTYIATILSIINVGAKPVLVEPCIKTYNIDYKKIEAKITEKTKCIIPVHLYGQPANMSEINQIAKKNKLYVVEDNAQAQGATWNKKKTGSFGILNATSFYPGKNLGALGDAGAITTDDVFLSEKLKSLRNYGSSIKYENQHIGYNNRLDECQAGFLSIKLKFLEYWNRERISIAKNYNQQLDGVGDLILPFVDSNAISVFHIYCIRSQHRDKLQSFLTSKGIGTLIHYPIPPHKQACFKGMDFTYNQFPIATELAKTSLSLPIWPGISLQLQQYVIDSIKVYFSEN